MNSSRWKKWGKATKKIEESLVETYIGIGLQMKSMYRAWFLKKCSELKHFSTNPRCNWTCRVDQRSYCAGFAGAAGKMVGSIIPKIIACSRRFYISSVASEEQDMKLIMEDLKADN